MANDIGNFFRAEPEREEVIESIAHDIAKYWTRRIRQKIAARGEAGLDDLPREAHRRLTAFEYPAPDGLDEGAD